MWLRLTLLGGMTICGLKLPPPLILMRVNSIHNGLGWARRRRAKRQKGGPKGNLIVALLWAREREGFQ